MFKICLVNTNNSSDDSDQSDSELDDDNLSYASTKSNYSRGAHRNGPWSQAKPQMQLLMMNQDTPVPQIDNPSEVSLDKHMQLLNQDNEAGPPIHDEHSHVCGRHLEHCQHFWGEDSPLFTWVTPLQTAVYPADTSFKNQGDPLVVKLGSQTPITLIEGERSNHCFTNLTK